MTDGQAAVTGRRRQPRHNSSPATAIRLALLVLCSVTALFAEFRSYTALPTALLAALVLVANRAERERRHVLPITVVEAVIAGAAVCLTGGPRSPMLPYLLAPGVAMGLTGARVDVLLASAGCAAGAAMGRLAYAWGLPGVPSGTAEAFTATVSLWVVLGLALGLSANWSRRLSLNPPPAADSDRYGEARALLRQLRGVTEGLTGGLDLPAAAMAVLDKAALIAPSDRSAVLVETGTGSLVPAAVRGTSRMPWRAPLASPGPLRQSWDSCAPVVDVRPPDVHGRRLGSTLAVIPLVTASAPFGLLALEVYEPATFSTQVIDGLVDCAAAGALRIETALLFDDVRRSLTLEERNRLARQIHDGLAQDLASFGYRLDELVTQARTTDPALASSVAEVRRDLTGLISSIRLSITELRTSVDQEGGLGAAIASYLRAMGSGTGLAVHLSLDEAAFRLPADSEVLLFQALQAVAQHYRLHARSGNLWVALAVDPPSARLTVEHDAASGSPESLEVDELDARLRQVGGALTVSLREGGGVRVDVVFGSSKEGRSS